MYAASYDRLLETYAACFGRENMHVMILEEMASNEENVLRKLCKFLNVPFFPMDQSKADKNEGSSTSRSLMPIQRPTLSRLLQKFSSIFRIPVSRDRLSILTATDEAFIRSFYAVSNYRASVWLDQDLAHWGYPI